MPSERIQRQVERLLDEAEEASAQRQWQVAKERAEHALTFDPENADASALLEAAERGLASPGSPPTAHRPAPSAEAQPTSFANGRYEVRRFLGEGGKKRVYLAHDAQLDRDVAFALIKTEGLDDASRVRITREAQAMGRLGSHPHIVTVYDIGEENGQPYLVLPVLPGGDVEGVIEDAPEHKLSIEQAVKIATETCLGLEFSHAKGIIHRDLKPGNVWLAEDGRAMIGDFGLAVAVDRSRLTQAGMMVGTVNYMPPEQAMGGDVTPQSDLYSLGAMLYEMVCGRPPFVGDESVAIIGQHLNTPPVAPTWHRPGCPLGLEALILRLLEKDPERRPASATEVREALEGVTTTPARDPSVQQPVESRGADPLYRRVFVGREAELRQLQQAYDAAVSGQGGLAMVVGEPGIGKTAICEQLATYVSIRGGRTLVGHCYEEGSLSLPYLAFVEAMRTYVLDRDPEALKSELGSGADEVARIVSEVRDRLHVEISEASGPEDDRWRLLSSVTTFLRNASSVQPLVIVLEDLHWADRGTLDLLQHVARSLEGARLLIVGTYRDVEVDRTHPLSGAVAELRRASNFLRVPLRGLTIDEVHRMYEAVRGNDVPWGAAETVYRQTEGNPLFVQEVLRYLVEEGIVVREDGEYVVRGDATAIPEGLRDVVGRRLSRLSPECNRLLAVASIIGRDFRLDTLTTIAGFEEDDLLALLEEATRVGVLEEQTRPGFIAYRFTHAFFRQTLYEELSAPRRLRMHQDVARALEQQYEGRLQEHAAEMAEHFANSTDRGDLAKAIDYSEMAAARAMSVFDYGEAARLLEKALDAQEVLDADDASRRFGLLLALGKALFPMGEYRRVTDEIAPACLAFAQQLHDYGNALSACLLALDSFVGRLNPDSDYWLEMAYRYVGDDETARARLNRRKGRQLFMDGRQTEGLELFRESMKLAADMQDFDAESSSLIMAMYSTNLGLKEVLAILDDLHGRSREGVDPLTMVISLLVAAGAYLANGQRTRANEIASELRALASRHRVSVAEDSADVLDWVLSSLDGELQARSFETRSDLNQGDRQWGVLLIGLMQRDVSLYLGFPQVEIAVAEAATLVGRVVHVLVESTSDDPLGAPEALPGLVTEVTELDLEAPNYALTLLMEAALNLQDEDSLEQLLEAVSRRQITEESLSLPDMFPRPIFRTIGDAAAFLARPEEARECYTQNLALCERVGHRPEVALTRAHLAELLLDHYPDERDAAIEHLDFAIAEFRDMKMQPALERALGRRGLLKA